MKIRDIILDMYMSVHQWFEDIQSAEAYTLCVCDDPRITHTLTIKHQDGYHQIERTEKLAFTIPPVTMNARDLVLDVYENLRQSIASGFLSEALVTDVQVSDKVRIYVTAYLDELTPMKDVIDFMAAYPRCVFKIEWTI